MLTSKRELGKTIVVTFCLATLLLGCANTPTALSETNEVNRVRQAAEQWKSYYEANDYDGLMTLYTDNPRVYLHGQPGLVGMQAVRDYFKPRVGVGKATFELDYETIEVYGDLAILVSKYWLTLKMDDSDTPIRDQGRSMLIYAKDANNDWKIAFDIDQATPDVNWIKKELLEKTY